MTKPSLPPQHSAPLNQPLPTPPLDKDQKRVLSPQLYPQSEALNHSPNQPSPLRVNIQHLQFPSGDVARPSGRHPKPCPLLKTFSDRRYSEYSPDQLHNHKTLQPSSTAAGNAPVPRTISSPFLDTDTSPAESLRDLRKRTADSTNSADGNSEYTTTGHSSPSASNQTLHPPGPARHKPIPFLSLYQSRDSSTSPWAPPNPPNSTPSAQSPQSSPDNPSSLLPSAHQPPNAATSLAPESSVAPAFPSRSATSYAAAFPNHGRNKKRQSSLQPNHLLPTR